MCGQDTEDDSPPMGSRSALSDFPWHVGVFDAHNHIGERMATITDIPAMRARCLAVMATRSQDQALVASLAAGPLALAEATDLWREDATTVVPGFGRHPWFSHELYDDNSDSPTFDADLAKSSLSEAKMRHYAAVLTPSPDAAFVAELPTPTSLSGFISETRDRLKSFPLAMVGEIGLDKAFRLPDLWTAEARAAVDPARTPGGRNRRPLSRHSISLEHQKTVLMAHLRLAGEMGRAVSVHGVQSHGGLFDQLVSSWKGHEKKKKKSGRGRQSGKSDALVPSDGQLAEADAEGMATGLPFPPRVCLHSFSGKAEGVRQYLSPSFPADIFFSFSKTNNMRDSIGRAKLVDALKMVPDGRLLVESDIHTAGERMDAELEEMYREVCSIKGWELEEGVRKIAYNWEHFVFGDRRSTTTG